MCGACWNRRLLINGGLAIDAMKFLGRMTSGDTNIVKLCVKYCLRVCPVIVFKLNIGRPIIITQRLHKLLTTIKLRCGRKVKSRPKGFKGEVPLAYLTGCWLCWINSPVWVEYDTFQDRPSSRWKYLKRERRNVLMFGLAGGRSSCAEQHLLKRCRLYCREEIHNQLEWQGTIVLVGLEFVEVR